MAPDTWYLLVISFFRDATYAYDINVFDDNLSRIDCVLLFQWQL